MGKLYKNRALLGNIALVVFLAFLACFTFGVVTPVPAGAEQTLPEEEFQVDPDHPVAIKDKDGKWVKDFIQSVGIKTGIDGSGGTEKTFIDFTIQVLTPASFQNIMLMIKEKEGNKVLDTVYGGNISNVVYGVYNAVYNTVYYVYQFVYHWVYQLGLLDVSKNYALVICSDHQQLASITLALEEPPPEVEYLIPSDGVLSNFTLPAGKTAVLKSESGVELAIAPDTFSGAATVTVKAVDKSGLAGAPYIGQVTEIKIEDVELTKPVTVRLPVGEVTGNRIRAFKLDEARQKWVNMGGSLVGGTVEFRTSSFSKFTVADSPLPPVAQPDSGTYSGSVTVTLTAPKGDIYYSTDGTMPGNRYTGPLRFTSSTTLSALTEWNSIQSEIVVYNYTISSGGGGGGGGVTPPVPPTPTDTGTLTSTADGQATLTVDDAKVASLVARADVTQVEFAIPTDVVAKQGTVVVAADTLARVFEAGKPAVVKVGDAQLALPPGAIDLSVFKGQGVSLKVSVAKAGVPTAVGDAALKPAGDAFTFTIRAEAGGADKGGISTFSKPVTLVLSYDPAKLAGVPEDYLGIYRQSGGSWEYVGGKVDKAARKVSVSRTNLSTYAVMAYDKNFVDMAGHWAEADVKLMAAKHIAAGMTATTFAPDASVTRAQFAAFLLRALNIPEQKATGARFADVATDAWYAGAVETAAAQGLVSGYPDGTFKPDALITREEVAAMVTRALAKSGKSVALSEVEVQALLARFKDADDIGSWAKQAMAVAVKEGIVKGRLDDRCAPKANATRAEAVVMVKRLLAATGAL